MQNIHSFKHPRFNPFGNVPFRGEPGIYKRDEPRETAPVTVREAGARQFYMDDPGDASEYRRVLTLVAAGRGDIMVEEHEYSQTRDTWVVMLTWLEYYLEDPESAKEKTLRL